MFGSTYLGQVLGRAARSVPSKSQMLLMGGEETWSSFDLGKII